VCVCVCALFRPRIGRIPKVGNLARKTGEGDLNRARWLFEKVRPREREREGENDLGFGSEDYWIR